MAERQADERAGGQAGSGRALKRRGILAAAGAVVAGLVAKQASQPVGATHQVEDLGLGIINYSSTKTNLAYEGTALTSDNILTVKDTDAFPNFATPAAALAGQAINNKVVAGVYGLTISTVSGAAGVSGQHLFNGTGVYGEAAAGGNGVSGSASGTGNGVIGTCYGTTTSFGVWGITDTGRGVVGSATTGTGVYGGSGGTSASNGNGVYGSVSHVGSTQVTAGVFGDSTASYGVIGRTTAVNYSGCTGIADGVGRAAFAGAGTNGAYGAYFTGPTVIAGDFTVLGGHQKNAAVKHSDGSYRLLHCVESPEPWFEDFGEAKLVNGRADVKLDADFADVVDTSFYHVFLTTYGESGGLFVAGRSAGGFTVTERNKGTSSLTFSYRIVAKRKDLKVGRLAKFEPPKIRLPKPEEMPPPPQPPKKP